MNQGTRPASQGQHHNQAKLRARASPLPSHSIRSGEIPYHSRLTVPPPMVQMFRMSSRARQLRGRVYMRRAVALCSLASGLVGSRTPLPLQALSRKSPHPRGPLEQTTWRWRAGEGTVHIREGGLSPALNILTPLHPFMQRAGWRSFSKQRKPRAKPPRTSRTTPTGSQP